MSKPGTRRVPSDDCVITVDGVEFHPHEGEWVEVIAGFRIGDLRAQRGLAELQPRLEAVEGESQEGARKLAMMDDSFAELVDALSTRVRRWSWTDDDGAPLPQPYRNPDAFRPLRLEEIYYLATVSQGEAPAEKKDDTKSSETTSSVTAQPLSLVY